MAKIIHYRHAVAQSGYVFLLFRQGETRTGGGKGHKRAKIATPSIAMLLPFQGVT